MDYDQRSQWRWTEVGATWNNYARSSSWQTPGAKGSNDRSSTVLGTVAPTSTGTYTMMLNQNGLNVIQNWINTPSSNKGFILTNSTNSNGLNITSSESTTITVRPKLTVSYTN